MNAPLVPLGELLTPVSRPEHINPHETYRLLGARWYAGGLYIKSAKVGAAIRAPVLYRIETGDFVYNRLFAWMGSFALANAQDQDCYASNEFLTFKIDTPRLIPEYLQLYFSRPSVWKHVATLSTGSTPTSRNRLSMERFLGMKVPLAGFEDQSRIVSLVASLNGNVAIAMDRHVKVLASASLLRAVARNQTPAQAGRTVEVGDVLLECRGGTWGEANSVGNDERALILRANNITTEGQLVLSDLVARYVSTQALERLRLQDGDIILTKSNSAEIVGNSALFQGAADRQVAYVPSNFLQLLRVDRNRCEPGYLWNILNSAAGKSYLRTAARGTSPSLQNLNSERIRKYRFVLPDIVEQRRALRYWDELDHLTDALARHECEVGQLLSRLPGAAVEEILR